METSRGIYKPIRVLFGTPIYETALNTCWNIKGYKTQIAMMMEFLRLQQERQIPLHITAEDMGDLLVEESNKTVREQLWEYKLEAVEETEAKPLLKLVWAVNIINKMRDVEFQARMFLQFPEATPPTFETPKLLSLAQKYIEILKDKQQESQTSRLLTAEEVVVEVVPRVLHGFWQLPPRPLLNVASRSLSTLCTSLTKATLDKVSKTFTAMECQAIVSRSIRDDVVQTILREIREQFPPEILLNSILNLAPVLLTMIAVVAKRNICKLLEESPFQSLLMSEVQPSEEPPAETPSLSDVCPSEEPPAERLPESAKPKMKKKKKKFFFSRHSAELCAVAVSVPPLSGVQFNEELPSECLSMFEVQTEAIDC